MFQELEQLHKRRPHLLMPQSDSLAVVNWAESSRKRLRGKVGSPIHDPFWMTPISQNYPLGL